MKPRQLVHQGTVQAAAFWIDESIAGQKESRRRVLAMNGVDEVRRMEYGLFVRLHEPQWTPCNHAPGVPLVVCRSALIALPLDDDEMDRLAAPAGAVVLAHAGETRVIDPQVCPVEDVASWVDLSDWNIEEVAPLGRIWHSPQQAPVAKEIDTRQIAGIGKAPPEAAEVQAILEGRRPEGAAPNSGGWASSLLTSLSTWLSSIAAKLGRTSKPRTLPGKPLSGRALVAGPRAQTAESTWSERLRMALNTAAARLLVWARLASYIGRKQADYLEKTFDLFDSGNLEEALRHAIPLGTGSDKPKPLALSVPTPRTDLSISPTQKEATSTLGFGGNVFDALRTRYRKAVEQLEKQGKIKEAAFVLAELLGASEEAVSFLEKHREYQLAAELAEGRGLDPALIVRQWMLAGNRARAMLIARRTGAFAAAIARLEPSHPEHAGALRILWANQLAESGAYGAAVQTIWPVEKARHLAREWLDRGIEIGGTSGARLLATKAWLVPEEFASVAGAVRSLPRDNADTTIETWTALGQAIIANPSSKTMQVLARACLRQLLPHANDGPLKSLTDRLTSATEDPVLLADLRRQPTEEALPGVQVSVHGLLDIGKSRDVNEDAYVIASFDGARSTLHQEIAKERPLPPRGLLLAIADGMGGYQSAEVAKLALDSLVKILQTAGHDTKTMGKALAKSVEESGVVLYQRALKDRRFLGTGTTITAAWLRGDIAWIAQVGDTRAYLWRNGKLQQLTKDHSLLQEMLASGHLTPEQAETFEHKSVITRALGTTEHVKVDLYRVVLNGGDRLLLCTDGVHGMISDEEIADAIRRPYFTPEYAAPVACEALKKRVYDAGAFDNIGMLVADVRIRNARGANDSPITVESIATDTDEKPAPTARIITRTSADVGSTPVHDAVVLPDGRLLAALGEAGVRLISPEGKTLAQFDQPAERLVISDHGDRAIALIRRGEAYRTARIDLVRRRSERWFDAALEDFTDTFDGSVWFVSTERGIFAIDALEDSFSAIWDLKEPNGFLGMRFQDAFSFCSNNEVWTIDAVSYRIRLRRPLDLTDQDTSWPNIGLSAVGTLAAWAKDNLTQTFVPSMRSAHEKTWTFLGEGTSFGVFPRVAIDEAGTFGAFGRFDTGHCGVRVWDLRDRRLRFEMQLDGASMLRVRFQHRRMIIADDRGRVLVFHTETGKSSGEWRI
jgi:serine/threonine protein phosphatase PrpC